MAQGTRTTDQADRITPGSGQVNPLNTSLAIAYHRVLNQQAWSMLIRMATSTDDDDDDDDVHYIIKFIQMSQSLDKD